VIVSALVVETPAVLITWFGMPMTAVAGSAAAAEVTKHDVSAGKRRAVRENDATQASSLGALSAILSG
jgi:hypothetical protein